MIRKACLEDAFQIAQVHAQSCRETYFNIVRKDILDQLDEAKKSQYLANSASRSSSSDMGV